MHAPTPPPIHSLFDSSTGALHVLHVTLTALNREDTERMIAFRWMVASGTDLPFTGEAINAIFRATLGLPQEIVKVCDLALVRAYAAKRRTVGVEDVRVAAAELHVGEE
jgi:general secretion pathway protein A